MGMTQVFSDTGNAIPVTVIQVGPCIVTQIKTDATDRYEAIQIGYSETTDKHLSKPEKGHLARAGIKKPLKHLKEFRINSTESFQLGQVIEADWFEPGQLVNVTGTSIGKGFAGNQKRHNFKRGAMSHGSKNHRLPGSTGAGTTPGRVYPGKKMPGRLGGKKNTVRNLQVVQVDVDNHLLVVKGSVPGKPGTLLTVTPNTTVAGSQKLEIERKKLEDVYHKYQLEKEQTWVEKEQTLVNMKDLKEKFRQLSSQWRSETVFISSMKKILNHPAYLKIIEFGMPVVPLILSELEKSPDFWFTALTKITGKNPISNAEKGDLEKMTKAWLNFAKKERYI